MALAGLRDSEIRHRDDFMGDLVVERFQVALCTRNDALTIVAVAQDSWDVLDEHHPRAEDLGGTCHAEIQGVLRVDPPGVIVQIAVPLARWAAHEHICVADRSTCARLDECRFRSELPVEERFNGGQLRSRGIREIRPVNVDGRLFEIDR